MNRDHQHRPAQRLLIVMPTWLGDVVMATPTLRSLRQLYPDAHITALIRASLEPILDGCPWLDQVTTSGTRRSGRPAHLPSNVESQAKRSGRRTIRSAEKLGTRIRDNDRAGVFGLARRLKSKNFDTAVLLPNSFRWALVARMAKIPRRIGYDRDGRGGLLTDRLLARRNNGQYVPVSTRDYYLGIARYLGAQSPDPKMELFTRSHHDARSAQMLVEAGVPAGQPLVIINPGASYGKAKMWNSARFADVADRCMRELGASAAISGAPDERNIIDQVIATANRPIIDLLERGSDLTLLKSVIKQSSLLITNDTGPRHLAAAFHVPVVTIFGPTDPAWTKIDFELERQVWVDVYCRPCQKKKCPLHGTADFHQCMKKITVNAVFDAAAELLSRNDSVISHQ